MIKKLTLIVNLLLIAAVFSACASSSSTRTANSATAGSQDTAVVTGSSVSVNLLGAGTLKLEGTSLAVTSQQSKDLLFLWKAVKSLGSNSNTAQDEIAALYQQIKETMTSEQVQALQNMTLANEDIQALMQQYGIQSSSPQSSTSEQGSGNRRSNMGGFDGPPGGFGGDMPPGAQSNRASAAAQSSSQTSQDLNALFADAIIELLQQRVAQ
jgi:hypothetical protein